MWLLCCVVSVFQLHVKNKAWSLFLRVYSAVANYLDHIKIPGATQILCEWLIYYFLSLLHLENYSLWISENWRRQFSEVKHPIFSEKRFLLSAVIFFSRCTRSSTTLPTILRSSSDVSDWWSSLFPKTTKIMLAAIGCFSVTTLHIIWNTIYETNYNILQDYMNES